MVVGKTSSRVTFAGHSSEVPVI